MTTESNNQENITAENSEEKKIEAPAAEEKEETAAATETAAVNTSSEGEKKPADAESADVRKPSERRPDSNQGPRRENTQGDRYQKRDSSQRFSKFRRKVCYYCANKDAVIDYKDSDTLDRFITDRGKILPRRVTGVCAKHQRGLANAIKKARIIALVPFLEK